MHGQHDTATRETQASSREGEMGMLPIFESQPGFKAYSLIDTGDEIVSFSAWDSAQDAEAANAAAASWSLRTWPMSSSSGRQASARSSPARRWESAVQLPSRAAELRALVPGTGRSAKPEPPAASSVASR
jgi:hypothetical protein